MKNIIHYKPTVAQQLVRVLFIALLLVCFNACSKSDTGGDGRENPPQTSTPPSATTLVFPNNNSECTEGTNFTTTESTVDFEWNESANTDTYNLVLKDLDAQITTTYSSSSTILAVKIKRGNPYSWYVVSKSNSSAQTANSATWKFYNAGEAVVSYAPFPAEVVSPAINFNVDAGAITLEWSASDVDNDIENYDVYFGEENPPAEYTTNVTETALENVSVTSGKTYYWQILTRDTSGNTSLSDVFSFNVN